MSDHGLIVLGEVGGGQPLPNVIVFVKYCIGFTSLRWLLLLKKPYKFLLIFAALIVATGVFTGTHIDYSATCVRCLQEARGDEYFIFGIRISHQQRLVKEKNSVVHNDRLPSIPLGRVETFELIHGQPCEHKFKRFGYGRSGLIFGGIACGSYGEGSVFRNRIYALSALDQLWHRVPDLALARDTYAVIDSIHPVELPPSPEIELVGGSRMFQLSAILNLTQSDEQWEDALDYFESGFSRPSPPQVKTPEYLLSNLESPDPTVRQTCAFLLSFGQGDLNANSLLLMLNSSDSVIVDSDDHHRQSTALAGMGLIADSDFEPIITQFRDRPPVASQNNQYPAAVIFKNPYYARFLDYAAHRCAGIHRWQLRKDANQQYYLATNPGQSSEEAHF